MLAALDGGYCCSFNQGIATVLVRGISVDYVLIPLVGEDTPMDATSQ